ncbi:hypothetical protein HYC85_029711 [Camellia sinensis]|uniref:Retrotransposon gag domain-containing protein n=1 Tax=Camellia sinensis TaxID=4442 RepID=A0A7J7FYN0_CAMSI|nr:hypothetical protein HYC85_029711 [Camellia sinensis]
MAKHLKDLLSSDRIAGFKRHFSIPDDVRLSLVKREDETTIVFPLLSIAEGGVRFPLHPFLRVVLHHWGLILSQPNVNFFRITMGVIALNRRLRFNLGIPAIRHCYALAKSSGQHGRFFLRANDIDHQLITTLSSFGKRVDDVMVVVQGRNLKKVLSSTDGAVLSDIEVALKYFGRRSLQQQGRAAHILLRYEPTYTTFSAAENIPVPEGEDSIIALILSDFKNLRQISPKIESNVVLNSADPPSASGRGDLSLDSIFHSLEDIFAVNPENMAGLSLTKLARKVNAERLAARRRAEALPSEVPPATESQFFLPGKECLVRHPHIPPAAARGHRLVFVSTGNIVCRSALFSAVESGLRTGREGVLIADLHQSYPSSRAEATLVMTDMWPFGTESGGSPGTIASEGSDIPGTQQTMMAQGSEEFVAVMAALNQGTAMQAETSIEMQRPSGASVSHPALGPQPNFDPLPPVEDLQCPNPRERLTQAQVLRPLVQPNERLYSLDVNELNPTAVKIVNLERQFKKAQGLNSIPDIEDGHTEAAVRLPDRFKMPYIDRFDGSGDPMVHIRLFLDVLKPMGLTKPQKLSLYGRTLSGVAATWYAKLEDKVKRDWEELAEAFID